MVGGIPGLLMFLLLVAFLAGENKDKALQGNEMAEIVLAILAGLFLGDNR